MSLCSSFADLKLRFIMEDQQQPHQKCKCYEINKTNNQNLYKKFVNVLESELRKKQQQKDKETSILKEELSKNKLQIMRLQCRNKLDQQNERKTKNQLNEMIQKINFYQKNATESIKQQRQTVREIVKEVFVKEPLQNDDQSKKIKEKLKQLMEKNSKLIYDLENMKNQKLTLEEEVQEFKKKFYKDRSQRQHLEDSLNQIQKKLKISNDNLKKLEQINSTLEKQSKKVIIQEVQKIIVKTQTKIQPIYIQRPVEKLVYVNVPTTIRQFIQPQRPVVNRIIQCQSKCNCKEQSTKSYERQMNQISQRYENIIEEMKSNINSYKTQRQKLVEVIRQKNSELNQLQLRLRLNTNSGYSTIRKGPTLVDVTVTKQEDEANKKNIKNPNIRKK